MKDWHKAGRMLNSLLRLRTPPVAVKILKKADKFPADAKHPLKDLGVKIAICQGMGMARRLGWTVAMEPKENVCPSSTILFGWADLKDKTDFANAWLQLGYGKEIEATRRSVEAMPRFKIGECRGLVFSPLQSTKIVPDLVLLYCDSAQAMNLIHGCTFKEGGSLTFSSQGRSACVECIIPTVLKREPQITIPCAGDRAFEMTQDDELIFTLPAERVDEVIQAIQARRREGYPTLPVNRNLVFQPHLPEAYGELKKKLKPVS